ncbi:MAG: DUF3108 domain-containing protein [Candidatus Puniceispirillum sp.]|nr:DUF3108 domain-containing protein [Candidatus Puniceispirillum sp.]
MRSLLVLALFGFWAGAAAAAPYQSTTLVYDVSWGNILLAKSKLDYRFGPDKARILASVGSTGLAVIFSEFKSNAEAELVLAGGNWQPKTLMMARLSGGDTVKSRVIWDSASNVISETRIPELDLDEVYPLGDQMRVGVIDPYSAVLRLINQIEADGNCTASYEIYDGRRRSRMSFETIGAVELTKARPDEYEGSAMACRVQFIPIGGHRIESKWRGDDKPDNDRFKMFFGRPSQGQLVPVRIEVKSWIGKIIGRLDMGKIEMK